MKITSICLIISGIFFLLSMVVFMLFDEFGDIDKRYVAITKYTTIVSGIVMVVCLLISFVIYIWR